MKADQEFSIASRLAPFAFSAKNSKEFQGHGWGCSYRTEGTWKHYKSSVPIWEDNLHKFGKTTFLVAHARSAFRNEGISLENNMPFYDGRYVFIFNGELQGVRIKEEGRIGAEKVFNYIKRRDSNEMAIAMSESMSLLSRRSRYVRAMNMAITDGRRIYVASTFNEDPEYFTMWYRQTETEVVVCSEKITAEEGWKIIENGSVMVI